MQHQHDFITPPPEPIVIEYEDGDEPTHHPPFYFCNLGSCPCHRDPELTYELWRRVNDGEFTAPEAIQVYWNLH
jgi:hypothetical protein